MTNSAMTMIKESNIITRINKSHKLLSKSFKSDSLCLPSPKLNKRYRYSVLPSNEELNNKIDLEIRILDGILKLLNAICSNTNIISNSSQSNSPNNSYSSNTLSPSITASSLINNLDVSNIDDLNKCSAVGAQIAAALASNKITNESSQIQSENPAFDANSPEYNHVIQILTACKCLFVSHRKIAIFLQNLQEIEKKSLKGYDSLNISQDMMEDIENRNHNSILLSALDVSASINKNSTFMSERSIDLETCKLVLSDIRIPLSWKWTDYVKASKNSESVNCKFATFAVIFLGNMIYDTQLLSNIDASVTDINFQESFVFDDVKPNTFEITIEIYAYELYNTSNNILQSARKLAKQFTDFATFKKHGSNQTTSNQNVLAQMPNLFNNALTNSTNTYSYSMNKFKLIAKAVLNKNDVSEDTETRPLQIINDSNSENSNGSNLDASNTSVLSQNNFSTTTVLSSNKLPLFDYFSCRLKTMATSSFI
ncbi:unnamed protein product [Brachionus calyciflorus]|uniref:Anillin homology domain-containing protein n=1 Tax=Brachionus calyciflorus TaxID=104777 RepID=A0A813S5P3_9BILA|nr:unnamed protein product [Brachionus calyciflorus]